MNFRWTQRLKVVLKIFCGLACVLCPKVFAEPVVTVRDNGNPSNRVDLVILGDGYTASEMNKFAADVGAVIAGLFDQEPLKEYRRHFNVHRIDVVSNESGADHPENDPAIEKDTAFDATYNCGEIKRLICIDYDKVLTVLTRSLNANRRDIIVMLVNDPKYGGAGGGLAVTSTNSNMIEIILHELGHSFAYLGDEYFYDHEEQCSDIEPEAPNVTKVTNRASIKWNHWIDAETEVPTRTDDRGVPGLYEGALYCPKGIFRPTFSSKMRWLYQPFEQINSEQIVKEIYNLVSPLDHTFPENGDLSLEAGQTQTFYVSTPVPASHELTVRWLVDGELQGTGLQYTLDSSRLDRSTHTVEVVVEDRTPLVRNDPDNVLMDRRTWHVTIGSATGKPDLVIASLTASSTAIVGRQASISAVLQNQGSADAGPFQFQAYLTRDFSQFLTLAECDFDAGLQAGQSSSCSGPVSLPSSLIPGVYYVGAFVDSHQQVTESNELNNKRLSDSGLFTVLESPPLFVPVILQASGLNDSFFTSELTLTNRGSEEATLHYTYTADQGGGSGTATDRLAPGRQRIEPNAISYLTGLGIPIPGSGNRIGTLRVEVSGSSGVSVVTRTTTPVPEGRAGLAYPGISENEGFQETVYLCGLRQNSRDRSNVAVQNMGAADEGPITLRATVYSGEADDTKSCDLGEMELKPGEFHQYNEVLKKLGSPAQGYVKVEKVEGEVPFYAYGVINDNFNSDGSFVFPVRESDLIGKRGQTLPVIIETGAFNSELTVTNFSASDKIVDFSFVADAITNNDDTATFRLTLKAGEQRIVPQIVNWLRQQDVEGIGQANRAFVGALFATAADGDMSGIVIGARTGAPDQRGGQYSLFYNGVPYGSASVESAWIYGLQQNAENRSNLALVNTGEIDDSSSTFEITIYDGSGDRQPRTKSVTLGPRRWTQENGILDKFSQGYVQVRKTSGNNPFVTYGVINDGGRPGQRSGDGAFLFSQE